MSQFRTVDDFLALTGDDAPTPAERKLIEACRAGEPCTLGDERPEENSPDRRIRATLLRLLIVGGTEACGLEDVGVDLWGGWISGKLDLDFANALGKTTLVKCHFDDQPRLHGARLQTLNLGGSFLPGLFAQGAEIAQDVFLRDGFISNGTVVLSAMRIGGQLDGTGGNFDGRGSKAIRAQSVEVGQDVFLSNGFRSSGTVDLAAARISGQLSCLAGFFDGKGDAAINAEGSQIMHQVLLNRGFKAKGEVALSAARIGGQISCFGGTFDGKGGMALDAAHAQVNHGFYWRDVAVVNGAVNLSDASVGNLIDDVSSWHFEDTLILIGFKYSGLGNAFRDVAQRCDWLAKGSVFDGEFYPQPYVQLAKVFREMGHDREARAILAAMERKLADRQEDEDQKKAERLRNGVEGEQGDIGWHWLKRRGFQLWDRIQRKGSGYGQRPEYALFWLLGAWGVATVVHFLAWHIGLMVPSSPVILTSADWQTAMQANPAKPAEAWIALQTAAPHYETFACIAYSLDVLLPILDVGQEAAWSPSTNRPIGWAVVILDWGLKIFGWLAAALFAATVGGLLQKDRG